jgi:molybdopterin synthase sulfur carrier subunit
MKIELRFFASLREALGTSQETIDVPVSVSTITELRAHLMQRGDAWSRALADGQALRCALNQRMVDASAPL